MGDQIRLSLLIEDAMSQEPQVVIKHGEKAVVFLSFERTTLGRSNI